MLVSPHTDGSVTGPAAADDASTATLPLMIASVFGFGLIFQTRGSYAAGIVAMIAYFVIVVPLAIVAGRRKPLSLAVGTPA